MESNGLRIVGVNLVRGWGGTWKIVRKCDMTAVTLELMAIYQEQ